MPDLNTRPEIRRVAITALLLVVLLAAIPAVNPLPARAQADAPIVIGMTDMPRSVDPGEAGDFNSWELLRHLYTGLTRQIPGTFEYELALAQDVQIGADNLRYTFTLRDDIAFTDGTPITAQTFVDSIERVLTLRRGASDVVRPYVDEISAPDDRTLVFDLARPVPYFLALVSLPPYFPQHPDLAAENTTVPFSADVTGNGPYLLDSFESRGQIVLRANPNYDLGPQPQTATIILQYYARSQDLRNAIAEHEIDLAWRALLLSHLEQLKEEDIDGLAVMDVPSTRVFYLYFGQVREPTDDPLVREALTLLIEREEAAEEVFNRHVSPLTSLVPAFFPEAYHPIWPDDPDYEAAEDTLLAAGYRERQTSRLNFFISFSQYVYGDPYTAAVTQLARSSFSGTDYVEYGIYSDIEPSTFLNVLREGTGSVAIYSWDPVAPHPHAYLFPLLHSSQPIAANSRYATPEVDALLEQAAIAADAESQGELYREVAERLYEDFAIIPLWQDGLQVVAWDDISGIQVEPNFFLRYDLLVRE